MCAVEECYLVETAYSYEVNGKRYFNRGNYIPYRTISNFVNQRNSYSAFASNYRYRTKNVDESDLYGDFYLDFDDIENFEHARRDALSALSYIKIVFGIPSENLYIYYSGNKGIHIMVPAKTLGIQPIKELNGVFKMLATSIKMYTKYKTVDTQVYDNKRLFRIPNTMHEKSGLYKIPITPLELAKATEEEIKTMALTQRPLFNIDVLSESSRAKIEFEKVIERYTQYVKDQERDIKNSERKISFVPPCIENILKNGAVQGERNITIACLASFYKSYGKSLNETIDLIREWNDKNAYPTGDTELTRTTRSIYTGGKLYGCNTLKSLNICSTDCKINKNKNK